MSSHSLPISGFEPDSTTFIATFGSGQVHAGGYVEIQADSSDEAYVWMSERYSQKWCSLYGKTSGLDQIEKWDYRLVCFADIRSGNPSYIQPVNELILPPNTTIHGQVEPILRTPGEIKIYYHNGLTLDQKLEDIRTIVPFLTEIENEIISINIDVNCMRLPAYVTILRTL